MPHDELPPSPYYLDQYLHPSVGRQLRESLSRQRSQGVQSFDLAWRQARRKVKFAHEGPEREQEKRVLADPVLRAAWQAAYERRSHPCLDALAVLTAVLEEADLADALKRDDRRVMLWRAAGSKRQERTGLHA